jgi:glycosyltransferase involved in cell wall biosynthesis
MDKNILLTISIPTFNRSEKLRSQLNNIHSILLDTNNSMNVEIVVSDNCSNDSTSDVIEAFSKLQKKYKFTHIKNSSNLGGDMNWIIAITKASGRFVWSMSDDDEIEKDSIQYLLDVLSTNKDIGFGFINFYFGKEHDRACIKPNETILSTRDVNLLILPLIGTGMSSSCIFRRSLLSREVMVDYIDTAPGYPHMFYGVDNVKYFDMLVIHRPLFTIFEQSVEERRTERSIEKTSFDFYLAAHLSFLKYTTYITSLGLSIKSRFRLHFIAINENLNQILFHKITTKKYDFLAIQSALIVMIKRFYYSPVFWLIHIPLLVAPSILSRVVEPYRWKYINLRGKLSHKIKHMARK